MQKRITILKANMQESKLLLESNEPINGLVPGEQILVDSDHYSFIYLMENQEDYTYIVLPEELWSSLKAANEQGIPVCLLFEGEQIELLNFHDELEYVISNIKGNSNYGNEMVTRVDRIF
ncbi:hypothetical protein J1P26_23180 [Neobacillus sp. MM2021_6]|uniref:UPF0738 family protein n=1 Tax=Bacillaceae TaxID=186817 RepID=UPI00140A69E1|nr:MULTISPECIES: hypothetical protein [Bacillaceae]MBO0962603.1 hypothetical protein [Neobacillus sp. MM2021_6]NHC16671.1 hypothetical protein [Bacillus sp. MM2020_4]WML38804.1 hypothetical protein RCG19_16605 [Neobacillus sp. OS1-2]